MKGYKCNIETITNGVNWLQLIQSFHFRCCFLFLLPELCNQKTMTSIKASEVGKLHWQTFYFNFWYKFFSCKLNIFQSYHNSFKSCYTVVIWIQCVFSFVLLDKRTNPIICILVHARTHVKQSHIVQERSSQADIFLFLSTNCFQFFLLFNVVDLVLLMSYSTYRCLWKSATKIEKLI